MSLGLSHLDHLVLTVRDVNATVNIFATPTVTFLKSPTNATPSHLEFEIVAQTTCLCDPFHTIWLPPGASLRSVALARLPPNGANAPLQSEVNFGGEATRRREE